MLPFDERHASKQPRKSGISMQIVDRITQPGGDADSHGTSRDKSAAQQRHNRRWSRRRRAIRGEPRVLSEKRPLAGERPSLNRLGHGGTLDAE
jgi:hypothetical protein